MRIGIDAHAAESEGKGNCTYIRRLLEELGSIDTANDYIIYAIDLSHPFYQKLKKYKNFQIKSLYVKNPLVRIPLFLGWRSWVDELDLLHVQYIAPPLHRGQLVLTIHDLGHFTIPDSFSRTEVLRSKILIPKAVRQAKIILTGSQYSRSEIVEKFNLSPEKVVVIPNGVSSWLLNFASLNLAAKDFSCLTEPPSNKFQPASRFSWHESEIKKVSHGIREEIKRKYGLKSPYFFTLSRLNPRKNIPLLIEAFNLLKETRKIPHQLVIGGRVDVKFRKIKQAIENSSYQNDIRLVGFIPDDELGYVFSGAEAFIFLSEYEGFGLPVVEAMACGVPVITSFVSSLPEVAADAALYVEKLTLDEVAAKILALLEDKKLSQTMREKGFQRARLFSWRETARLTLQAYEWVREQAVPWLC